MTGKKYDRHRLFMVLTWLWLLTLTVLLLLPGRDIPSIRWGLSLPVDKVVHFLSFFLVASGFLLSMHWEEKKKRRLVFMALLAYAVIMEYIQHAVQESRAFEREDIFANLAGVVCAYLIYLMVGKIVKN